MAETTITSWKPDRVCHDAGPVKWRGGWIVGVNLPNVTLKLHLEAHVVGERTIAASLLPEDGAAVVGAPCYCRLEGAGAHDYVVMEVRSTRFAWPGPGTDQAGAVARGEFHPGHIPYEAFGEQPFWWKE